MADVVNRRTALVGLGSGALTGAFALLAPKKAEAVTVPSGIPFAGGMYLQGLPPGLVEIETVVRDAAGHMTTTGDAMEIQVASNGTALLAYRQLVLLSGLWQIYKPGTTVIKKNLPKPGQFDLIYQKIVPAVDGVSATAAWAYRHPSTDPGIQLRGAAPYQGAPMVLWLNSGPIQAITIQLVDLDISPSTSEDLQALRLSPLPPVREIIASWNFPAGSGSRTRLLAPFPVPWNARCFALRILQSLNQWVYVRLASDAPDPLGLGPLEIGWPL